MELISQASIVKQELNFNYLISNRAITTKSHKLEASQEFDRAMNREEDLKKLKQILNLLV